MTALSGPSGPRTSTAAHGSHLGADLAVVRQLPPGVCALSCQVAVGSADDPPTRPGMAHLVEHLLFHRTRDRRAADSSVVLEQYGSRPNASTNPWRTRFFVTVPVQALDLALRVEGQRWNRMHREISAADIAREVEIVREEKASREAASALAGALPTVVAALFGPDHPYGRPSLGDPEMLDGVSAADVREFVEATYLSSRLSATVAGDVDKGRVLDALRHHVAWDAPVTPRRRPPVPVSGAPYARDARCRVPQGHERVHFALALGDPDGDRRSFVASLLRLDVLAGGHSSRVQAAMVRRGIPGRVAVHLFPLAERSFVVVEVGAAPEQLSVLRRLVGDELDRLVSCEITGREWEYAVAQAEREWSGSAVRPAATADDVGASRLKGRAWTPGANLTQLRALTQDEVELATTDTLAPCNWTIVEARSGTA